MPWENSGLSESAVALINDRELLPWKVIDPDGRFTGIVVARNVLDATSQLPANHSVYVGGPCPRDPSRPWWIDAWAAGDVDPDTLFANDPR